MGDPYSLSSIFWSTDLATQRVIGSVLGIFALAAIIVLIPLAIRLFRLFRLEGQLDRVISAQHPEAFADNRAAIRELLKTTPLAESFQEFERRWNTAQVTENISRSPIRLIDVLEDRPLLPFGPRRSLLPILPGLFLGFGVLAALFGLIPSLGGLGGAELADGTRESWMATQVGMALRATAWGFLLSIITSVVTRLIEGGFDARSRGLDALLERAFGSVSPGELAELTRQTQQKSLDNLGRELAGFANELNERMDRGLQRIEQSTARSANLVSQEQRGALHTVVQELSLSVRQGVEHHLSELRTALQRAVEHQSSVTGGLAETFERMVENSKTQDRVARTLTDSAKSVEEAARSMSSSAGTMKPVLEHLSATSRSLADTSDRIGDTQTVVARTAEGVRSSLEHAATGVSDQRQFIELSLGEIRRALTGLGDGLGDSLQRSLREVDNVLGSTVGQLRDTLSESNETIERLAVPIRAAEGTTRETHVALDRVRGEVEALQQWMNTALKPLRSGLGEVDGRVDEITRAITEFTSHTRQIDKTMESLRQEIHEESRRLQGAGSDLSRRLKLTSDAVGFFDSGAADGTRRRPDSRDAEKSDESPTRERSWSAAPATSTPASPSATSTPASPSTRTATTLGAKSGDAPTAKSSDASAKAAALIAGDRAADKAGSAENDAEDENSPSFSGFRVGAPRAQGPDPFARFDQPDDQPSNVRHFPTPDRELGDDLKLSGLLGPGRPGEDSPGDKATDEPPQSSGKKGKGPDGKESGGSSSSGKKK
ncbi:MAG: hypothetical protein AB8G23_10210 [Myxococcota bacterium]